MYPVASSATLLILVPVMVLVGYFDLRHMRIPNALSWILVALFGMTFFFTDTADFLLHILVAATVFAVSFTAFCFRILGGGDVKILSALVLFIPIHELAIFANVLSVALLFGVVFVISMRRLATVPNANWKFLSGCNGFPMGVSIAAAGIMHPFAAMMLGNL